MNGKKEKMSLRERKQNGADTDSKTAVLYFSKAGVSNSSLARVTLGLRLPSEGYNSEIKSMFIYYYLGTTN